MNVGELYLDAKAAAGRGLDQTGEKFQAWIEKDQDHAVEVLIEAAAGFATLSASAELAANMINRRRTLKAALGRGGLHLVAASSLSAAGFSTLMAGQLNGELYEQSLKTPKTTS